MMVRSLYNGGFIPSSLKQCLFRTPNQFYSLRDLGLLQPCCCCFFCAVAVAVFVVDDYAVAAAVVFVT